jgi:hypothetical protein
MTGHRPFEELTESFSEVGKTRVAARVSELKTEMALHASGQARAPDGQITHDGGDGAASDKASAEAAVSHSSPQKTVAPKN